MFEVDHFHVNGYKEMPPLERRKYVRGLLCIGCNSRIVAALESPLRTTAEAYIERYAMVGLPTPSWKERDLDGQQVDERGQEVALHEPGGNGLAGGPALSLVGGIEGDGLEDP